MTALEQNINEVKQLCVLHKVKSLFAFGSILTKQFGKNSDIDLIVDFDKIDPATYADNYFDLKFSLERILKRDVDLLEETAINNPYFRQAIDSRKQLVYGH